MFVQLKAAFLFIVFSLNMVRGFAWTAGKVMKFNAACCTEINMSVYEGSHDPQDDAGQHHKSMGKGKRCKYLPPRLTGLNAIFMATLISSFYNIGVLNTSISSPTIKFFVQSHHPPIPDIRIAIQSFQV